MRRVRYLVGLASMFGVVAVVAGGCVDAVALWYAPLTDPALLDGGTGATDGGGGAGGNPACAGDPTQDAALVSNECGVFVSASAVANGDGTKTRPFTGLSAAVTTALSQKKRVYACAESYSESATLEVNGALEVFGGFTGCGAAWSWDAAKRASYTGPANEIALVLTSGSGAIHVENVDVIAAPATVKGASSIAVYVNGGTVELSSSDVTADDGMIGEDGADAPEVPAQAGADGNDGGAACSADSVDGAAQKETTCGPAFSVGGAGGDGNGLNGVQGANGLPNNGAGQAGQGDDGTAGWSCAVNGGDGKAGAPGVTDDGGSGAPMASFGALSTSGFVGTAGNDGKAGTPGQGGGGGGGVRGGTALCTGHPGIGGASGGSGGSGGCGGLGGGGGKAGGASIALVSADAVLTLDQVKLKAGNGGNGGRGGNPQQGGAGSNGGDGGTSSIAGLEPGCGGGKGGKGGDGGPGGGGRGGHSIGLAVSGTVPQFDPATITVKSAGDGGKGGSNDAKMNHGDIGTAAVCWDFANNAECGK